MLPDLLSTWVGGVVVVLAGYGALFGGAELLRRRGISGERTRTAVHVAGGSLALGLPSLFGSPWPVVLLAIAFTGAMAASRRVGLLGSIHDVARPTSGAELYPLGVAAAFLLTGGRAPAYPISVLALALADPAASLVGRRLARRYLRLWGTLRSVEGSAGACAAGIAVGSIVLAAAGSTAPGQLLVTAITIGVAVALAEACAPRGLDNLAIPVAAACAVGGGPAVFAWPAGPVGLVVALAGVLVLGSAWSGVIVPAAVAGATEGRS